MLKVIQFIANELVTIMRAVMDSDVGINKKVGKNTLTNSDVYNTLNTVAEQVGDNYVISLFINHYIVYIESGRRKGATPPPFYAIHEWCVKKGLPSDNRAVWSIINAIVRDGISPRPILSTFFEHLDRKFDTEYFDMIFDELVERLDKYFND